MASTLQTMGLDDLLAPAERAFAEMPREHRVRTLAVTFRSWGDPGAAAEVAEAAVLAYRADVPPPPFGSIYGQAQEWARGASPGQIRAYAWACALAMEPDRRRAFLRALLDLEDAAA